MKNIEITYYDLIDVIPADYNPREINDEELSGLRNSIKRFGLVDPLIVNGRTGVLVGGHQRLRAAELEGYKRVPVIELDLNSSEEKALNVALNAHTLQGSFDLKKLSELMEEIKTELPNMHVDLNFDQLEKDLGIVNIDKDIDQDIAEDGLEDKYSDGKLGSLAEKYIVPPFSVLDTKKKEWIDRRDHWKKITGNLSESKTNVLTSGAESIVSSINEGSSNFDPVLAEIMFRWFCPEGGKVLDPFGGEQTKGVVAGELGLTYHACEFRKEQVDINESKTKKYENVKYVHGDSNFIDSKIKERNFNLCFTSPPYYDLEIYSKEDMSALGTYEEFMSQYKNIFTKCFEMLENNSFMVIKIGEIRNKKNGIYRNFLGDNISTFLDIGFKYYNELVLLNAIGTSALRANNTMKNRKMVKIHQNVLVFVKGDPIKAAEKLTKY